MLLSKLVGKRVYTNDKCKGVCVGVGVSLKTYEVKYLLCSENVNATPFSPADYAVNFRQIARIDEQIVLSSLRPVLAKGCAKIYLARPVYASDGSFVGNVTELEIKKGVAIRLRTNGRSFPLSAVNACTDAVLLKKDTPYPIGQPIASTAVTNSVVVTKSVLREAIAKSSLIRLTLSLSPFECEL